MFPSLDQILPSIEALGALGYWIIGLAAMLEAWFVTGVVVPGALVVDAGGILIQQGALDPIDLAWFVAIGSVLGTELGYWTGRWAQRGLSGRLEGSRTYARAVALFGRWGGLALVIGRFLGPVSGLVPMAAALAAMPHRRFLAWSILASVPYTIFHLSLGYLLGGAFSQLGPLATRIALGVLAVVLGLGLLVWLVARALRLVPFVLSVAAPVGRAIAADARVQALARRHPRLAAFVGGRLRPGRFSGLPATVLAAVFVYVLTIWAGSVLDWLTAAPVVAVDFRVANLMHAFWNPGALRLATHVTALGDTRVVALLTVALVVWNVLRGRTALAMGLSVAVAGNALTVTALKLIFRRDRPAFAYFVETTNSFPSGHAAISVAFWGGVLYVFWRLGWLRLPVVLVAAPLTALIIGGSRIYLAQHYLSDVLNGWAVGTLWLLAGIAVSEWWADTRPDRAPMPRASWAGGALALAALVAAGWVVVDYDKARAMPWTGPASVTVASVEALVGGRDFPPQTESVLGSPLEPVNLILIVPEGTGPDAPLQSAGWTQAAVPSPLSVLRAAWSALRNLDDPTAPVVPYFWDGVPNLSAWERAAADHTERRRHHVRLWRSRFRLEDGSRIWVAAASFDDGVNRTLLHRIAPDPDAERDRLAQDLTAVGAMPVGRLATGAARSGTSIAGDPWSSDGQAVILRLP
ncbi:MAG: LssY C-terminal domain-containing protein [Rhodobacteraceae bacterium]|nr:LssY C-terminal domain-containing protein [Paracoccaceae bacterium]